MEKIEEKPLFSNFFIKNGSPTKQLLPEINLLFGEDISQSAFDALVLEMDRYANSNPETK